MISRHLHIILPIDYIALNPRQITKHCFEKNKMQSKTLQVPTLLACLALLFIAGFSSAKYNHVGRDDEITAMKVAVENGISCIFSPIEKQITISDYHYF